MMSRGAPMARKPDARTFGQDIMRGEHIVGEGKAAKAKAHAAIPGGGKGPNSVYKFKTDAGYQTEGEIREGMAAKETASLRTGLTLGLTADAYRKEGEDVSAQASGTSIFDPVLCELAYRWFCPPGGLVLDPFAGGSVRGIVAAQLGRRYVGFDLRPEQVSANQEQAAKIGCTPMPIWHCADALTIPAVQTEPVDFILTCPPYGDLEKYSDDPADISNMPHDKFRAVLGTILSASVKLLKEDRFACVVIGDIRDKRGFYRLIPGFVSETMNAAGAGLYNECILVTSVGSLPVRVGKQFSSSRKLGKTHQNVLIYCKGDPVKAAAAIGDCEFADYDPAAPEAEASEFGERVVE